MSDGNPPVTRSVKSNEKSLVKRCGLMFSFYVDFDNLLMSELQKRIERLKLHCKYLLTHSGVHITQGVVQFEKEEKVRMLECMYQGFRFQKMNVLEFEEKIRMVHDCQRRVNQYGVYERPKKKIGGRLPYEIDPDYFSKYWNQRNNEEDMLKIRLKRQREEWRPYKYDPVSGVCIKNPVPEPEYVRCEDSSLVVNDESETEIDE